MFSHAAQCLTSGIVHRHINASLGEIKGCDSVNGHGACLSHHRDAMDAAVRDCLAHIHHHVTSRGLNLRRYMNVSQTVAAEGERDRERQRWRVVNISDQKRFARGKQTGGNYRKTTEVVQPFEENERGAHSENIATCGHTMEKKKRAAKPKMEKCVQKRYDRGGAERGQRNKQGRMEEEANQLYRR